MNKQKVIEAIHNLGGCDATEEWSKGYDAGITAALDAIKKIPDTDNNADLISRSELQQEIAKGVGECRIRAFKPSVNCILQIIHRMPAADVQAVRHGRWSNCYTDTHHYSGICSVCGHASIKNLTESLYEYCPRCGAKMDGDTNA